MKLPEGLVNEFFIEYFSTGFREFIISSEEFAMVSCVLAFSKKLFQSKVTLLLGLIIGGVDGIYLTKREENEKVCGSYLVVKEYCNCCTNRGRRSVHSDSMKRELSPFSTY